MANAGRQGRDPGAIDEEERQYAIGGQTLRELDEKYPNRPRNHGKTLFFAELYKGLFDPLSASRKQPARRGGRGTTSKFTPHEHRRRVIERFISRWRTEAGNDFFPALRLILPTSDRERGMYGLKESAIARLLIKLMRLDRHSDDAQSMLKWKRPDQSSTAGDFVDRCYNVLSKRPSRIDPGDMRIADVNEMLDKLSVVSGEKDQLPIIETFYERMNAEELQWVIRIILKQMRIGATERTILELWHPDAQHLYNVSSSLRRVCWELYDSDIRLTGAQTGVALMQCFQPQLAAYEMATSFDKMIERLHASTNGSAGIDNEFWIEEKLDGERMQLHMLQDESIPGGKRFCFWSRKAKNYTYLYGEGLHDEVNSALTRHLKNAFAPGVRNIILDGEMIVWDPLLKKVLKFGTLKSAALDTGVWNPYEQDAPRPVFRVFDIVLLNDQPLTQYTLRDRRNALAKSVPGEPHRLEVHDYATATSPDEIEPMLRKIVSDASEGLVVKNPRSMYTVGLRVPDWIKVKPDYMDGFGENVDVVIIGGYYGSGRRGGRLSSFMCGLRVTESDIKAGAHPEKCYSFIKVGGGFRAEDYAEIQHLTEGKWKDWDVKKPPSKYIQLAGGEKYQYERPDVWIRPTDSVVITVKAASAEETTSFASRLTLRFPRFKERRSDRNWNQGLDYEEFEELVAEGKKTNEFRMEKRRQRGAKRVKKEIQIAGQDTAPVIFAGTKSRVFDGLEFCVLTDCTKPTRKTKAQLETLVKENGGKLSQRAKPGTEMILVAEKKVVKVASLIKAGEVDIIRPKWLFDCIAQGNEGFLLPYETGHLFHSCDAVQSAAEGNTDGFGDSYARDLDVQELRQLLQDMPKKEVVDTPFHKENFLQQLAEHGHDLGQMRCHLFKNMIVHLAGVDVAASIEVCQVRNRIRFGGGILVGSLDDKAITHIVVLSKDSRQEMDIAAEVRSVISSRRPVPRVVSGQWVADCWENRTIVDEERFVPL
ncbi:ATP dependent DNA ligase domain-containing protein [Ustulina deusta]|nr:ATP dependent DNA ligase domain-containing protein [Ustulina deusta]KAI3343242.1 ATP dependent DNA ligase domain-containing protein [Ustulina deusta]